jgi:hypothetical protein
MTIIQAQAIWELCRQGFPLDAEDAAEHWENGEPYLPEQQLRVPRDVERQAQRSVRLCVSNPDTRRHNLREPVLCRRPPTA